MNWTPEQIQQTIVLLTGLVAAVAGVVAAISQLRGDLKENTLITAATNASVNHAAVMSDATHAAASDTNAQVSALSALVAETQASAAGTPSITNPPTLP